MRTEPYPMSMAKRETVREGKVVVTDEQVIDAETREPVDLDDLKDQNP